MEAAAFNSVVHRFPVQVHWSDCDPAGIIFYPTYFRWFDSATWAFFGAGGYPIKEMIETGRVMPLVSADCEFVAPAEPGDHCEVRTSIRRWGGKSFVIAHEVYRADGMLLARGAETRVWGQHIAGPGSPMKGQPITEELKALFRRA